jgi:hypothetical protein
MDYEIKFTVTSEDDNLDIIRFINSQEAFTALWKIRGLAMQALGKGVNEDEELTSEELRAYLEEIIEWTHVNGMF